MKESFDKIHSLKKVEQKNFQEALYLTAEKELLTEQKRKCYKVEQEIFERGLIFSRNEQWQNKLNEIMGQTVSSLSLEHGAKIKPVLVCEPAINAFVFKSDFIENYPQLEAEKGEISVYVNTGFLYYLSEHYRKKRELLLKEILTQEEELDYQTLSYSDSYEQTRRFLNQQGFVVNLEISEKLQNIYNNDHYFLTEDKIAAVFCHELAHISEPLRITHYNQQEMEYRADVEGQRLLDCVGFAPEAFEEILIFLEYLGPTGTFTPFGAHPAGNLRRKELQLAYQDFHQVFYHPGSPQKRIETLKLDFKNREVRRNDYVKDRILSCRNLIEIEAVVSSLENIDEYITAMHLIRERINYSVGYNEALSDPEHLRNLLRFVLQTQIARENLFKNLPNILIPKMIAASQKTRYALSQESQNFFLKNQELICQSYLNRLNRANDTLENDVHLQKLSVNLQEQIKKLIINSTSDDLNLSQHEGLYELQCLISWSQSPSASLAAKRKRSVTDGLILNDIAYNKEDNFKSLFAASEDALTAPTGNQISLFIDAVNKKYPHQIDANIIAGPENFKDDDEKMIQRISLDDLAKTPPDPTLVKKFPLFFEFLEVVIKKYEEQDQERAGYEKNDQERTVRTNKNKEIHPEDFQRFSSYPFSLGSVEERKKIILDIILKRFPINEEAYTLAGGCEKIPLLQNATDKGGILIRERTKQFSHLPGYEEICSLFTQECFNIFDQRILAGTAPIADFFQGFLKRQDIVNMPPKERVEMIDLLVELSLIFKLSYVDSKSDLLKYAYCSLNYGYDFEKKYYNLHRVIFEQMEGVIPLNELERLKILQNKEPYKRFFKLSDKIEADSRRLFKENISSWSTTLPKEKLLNKLKNEGAQSYIAAVQILRYLDNNPDLCLKEDLLSLSRLFFKNHFRGPYEQFSGARLFLFETIWELKSLELTEKFFILTTDYPEAVGESITHYFIEYSDRIGMKIFENPEQAAENFFVLLKNSYNQAELIQQLDRDEKFWQKIQKMRDDYSQAVMRAFGCIFFKTNYGGDQKYKLQTFLNKFSQLAGSSCAPQNLAKWEAVLREPLRKGKICETNYAGGVNPNLEPQQIDQFLVALVETSDYPLDSSLDKQGDLLLFMSPSTRRLYEEKLKKYYLESKDELERQSRRREVDQQFKHIINDQLMEALDESSEKEFYLRYRQNFYRLAQAKNTNCRNRFYSSPDKPFYSSPDKPKDWRKMRPEEAGFNDLAMCALNYRRNRKKLSEVIDLVKSLNHDLRALGLSNQVIQKWLKETTSLEELNQEQVSQEKVMEWERLAQAIFVMSGLLEDIKKESKPATACQNKAAELQKILSFFFQSMNKGLSEAILENANQFRYLAEFFKEPVEDESNKMFEIMADVYGKRGEKKSPPEELLNFLSEHCFVLFPQKVIHQALTAIYKDTPQTVIPARLARFINDPEWKYYDDLLNEYYPDYSKKRPAIPLEVKDYFKRYCQTNFIESIDPLDLQQALYGCYGRYGEREPLPEELQSFWGDSFGMSGAVNFIKKITPEKIKKSFKDVFASMPTNFWEFGDGINSIYYSLKELGCEESERPGSKMSDIYNIKSGSALLTGGQVSNLRNDITYKEVENYQQKKEQLPDYQDIELMQAEWAKEENSYSLKYFAQHFENVLIDCLQKKRTLEDSLELLNKVYPNPHDLKDIYLTNLFNAEICKILNINSQIQTIDLTKTINSYALNRYHKDSEQEYQDKFRNVLAILSSVTKVKIPAEALDFKMDSEDQLATLEKVGYLAKDHLRASAPFFLYQLGKLLYAGWEGRFGEQKLTEMFEESIDRLKKYLPIPSYYRNDLLDRIINRSAITFEQKERILNLYYSKERKGTEVAERNQKSEAAIWLGELKMEDLRSNLRKLTREQKAQYLLWLFGGEMPRDLLQSGLALGCRFNSFKQIFFSESRSVRNAILADLTMSGQGLFEIDNEKEAETMNYFLKQLFRQLVLENKIKFKSRQQGENYQDIFVAVFEGYNQAADRFNRDPKRCHELIVNLIDQMSTLDKDKISLPDFIAIFLAQCGSVGAKMAQVLSESDMINDEAIKSRLREFKENAGDYSKVAAFALVEDNGLLDEASNPLGIKVEKIGENIANASIKGVFDFEVKECPEAVVGKCLNYEGLKREKEDLLVLEYVALKCPFLHLPKFMIHAISQICQKERNFLKEKENQLSLHEMHQKRPEKEQYVKVATAFYTASNLMIEPKIPGMSLSDIEILKSSEQDITNSTEKRRLSARQEKIKHKICRQYGEEAKNIFRTITELSPPQIYKTVAKEVALELKEGVFHADLHTGNIFVDVEKLANQTMEDLIDKGDSPLYLLDCGSVSKRTGFKIDEFLKAVFVGDSQRLNDLLKRHHLVSAEFSSSIEAKRLRRIIKESLKQPTEMSARIKSLLWGLVNNGYHIEEDFESVIKGLASVYPVIEEYLAGEIYRDASSAEKLQMVMSYIGKCIKSRKLLKRSS